MVSKFLMFAKVSIAGFNDGIVDVFCFPSKEVSNMYGAHKTLKYFFYFLLKETGSCSLLRLKQGLFYYQGKCSQIDFRDISLFEAERST